MSRIEAKIDGGYPGRQPAASRGVNGDTRWTRRFRHRLIAFDSIVVVSVIGAGIAMPRLTAGRHDDLADISVYGALAAIAWLVALAVFRTRASHVLGSGADEYKKVLNATLIFFGVSAIVIVLADADVTGKLLVIVLPIGGAGLLVERWLCRRWLSLQRTRGRYLARALIVGDEADVSYVAGQIGRGSGGFEIVGAATYTADLDATIDADGMTISILCDADGVALALSAIAVDTVIVAGEHPSNKTYLRDLGWELESTSAELVIASRLSNVAGPRIHVRPVDGLPLMHVELPQYGGIKHVLKRVFDIAVSLTALIVSLPLMLVVALAIRLDSEGPIFFTQERVGRDGARFRMLKFRSMVVNAEDELGDLMAQSDGAGVLFKLKNDPRVTRVGRFLRQHSIDELPQLINILRGDMSLVGPRPPLPREVLEYEQHVRRRLYIRPGLTGMWQVNGRSNLDWEESVRLDLYYVENWSLLGDLMIIWRTIKVVLVPVGAY